MTEWRDLIVDRMIVSGREANMVMNMLHATAAAARLADSREIRRLLFAIPDVDDDMVEDAAKLSTRLDS